MRRIILIIMRRIILIASLGKYDRAAITAARHAED